MLKYTLAHLSLLFVAPLRLNWIMAATLAVSAASAAMGYMGDKKAEKAQQDAAEYQAALAKEQLKLQEENIAAAKEEARAKTELNMSDITRQMMRERANYLAGAGESGVAGGSVARGTMESLLRESEARGREQRNLSSFLDKAERDLKAAKIGMQASITPYKGTSDMSMGISAALDFAGSALSVAGKKGP